MPDEPDELAGKAIGERIQIVRERTGKTRPVVAGLVGRSPEWLKSVEKGRRQPPRLDMLVRLAEVLGVRNLAELTGETSLDMSGLQRRSGHPVVPAIREAIEGVDLTASDPAVDRRNYSIAPPAPGRSGTPRALHAPTPGGCCRSLSATVAEPCVS